MNTVYLKIVKSLLIFAYLYHPTIIIEFIHVLLLLVKIDFFVDVLVAFFYTRCSYLNADIYYLLKYFVIN